MTSITFLGAAQTVTGSKHLLDNGKAKILVDAGLFQGLKELRDRNWQDLPVKASEIDAIVLTHAHLDHCGYLPRLVSQGFRGRVFCTPGTQDLCRIVLPDSGRILLKRLSPRDAIPDDVHSIHHLHNMIAEFSAGATSDCTDGLEDCKCRARATRQRQTRREKRRAAARVREWIVDLPSP